MLNPLIWQILTISADDNFNLTSQVNDDDDRSYINPSTQKLTESTRRKLSKLMTWMYVTTFQDWAICDVTLI